jgi:hypothetical protein
MLGGFRPTFDLIGSPDPGLKRKAALPDGTFKGSGCCFRMEPTTSFILIVDLRAALERLCGKIAVCWLPQKLTKLF